MPNASSTMGCSPMLKHFSASAMSFRNCGILANSKPETGIKMGLFYFLLVRGRKAIGKLLNCSIKEELKKKIRNTAF